MEDLRMQQQFDPDQFVTVARFEDPVEAQMAKGMLESAGLECFLQGENANQLLGAAFRARLMVHRRDESAARELLPQEEEDGLPQGFQGGEEILEIPSSIAFGETSSRPKAVLCLSGGMDSTVCAALAARDHEVYALHFSYGQKTEAKERASAEEIARLTGVREFLPLKMDLFRRIGGSALTDESIAVPDAPAEEGAIGTEIPVTYVPFRNAHFLSAAVSWAEVVGAKKIFIGAVEQDSSGYPDCRPAYYDAFNALIRQGTREGDIRVETPLIHMRKKEIVKLGVELGAPFHVSWSCYSGEQEACGVCESCVLRLRAFREAGAVDPIPYAG